MGYNLFWVTLGNILGGMLFVGAAYWLICHKEITMEAEMPAAVPAEK
jgi:formate/nitrite transporter FocA (FNT family)